MQKIPCFVESVLSRLRESGFKAFIVGGCVRDMLLGAAPKDFDVATDALPEQVALLFEKTILTGIKHGTVTVFSEGVPVEVTTFRSDGGYSDFRRPDSVQFVGSLKEDLARRDFTVNAICYSPDTGFVDYFAGEQDLKNGLLRAVGDPAQRFREDALRILRLYRFASVLNFTPEEKTAQSALECLPLLQKISRERILSELLKTVAGSRPEILETPLNKGGLAFLGISSAKGLHMLGRLKADANLRLYGFLSLCECDMQQVLNELKASNNQKRYCAVMSELARTDFPETRPQIKNILNLSTPEILKDFFEICRILHNRDTGGAENLLFDILDKKEPYKTSDLKINGNDLKTIGLKGEEIKKALEFSRSIVIENPGLNNKKDLLQIVKNFYMNLI